MKKFYLVHRSFSVGGLILAAFFFCAANFLLFNSANAQNYQWAKSIGDTTSGNTYDDYGQSIAVDASGNIYTTGYFKGTADFDPGAGTLNLTSAGLEDIFIAKFNDGGNLVWAKSIGAGGGDEGHAIITDASGNVYTTGSFKGTVDFDPGAGTFNLGASGNDDIFISKLDASGNFVWAKAISGANYEWSYSIAVDGNGNCYIAGSFQGTVDFDPGGGTANLTAITSEDFFFAKYDSNGNYQWAYNIGTWSNVMAHGIDVDTNGNVYVAGYFQTTADFDPGPGVAMLDVNNGQVFLAKYDASGNYIWAKNITTTGGCYGRDIAVDDNGNCYVTGSFQSTGDFDPDTGTANLFAGGGHSVFFAKYNSIGEYQWAKNVEYYSMGREIDIDNNGNIYIIGDFNQTGDFDPGPGTQNLNNLGSEDIFFAKYDNGGNYVWAYSIGSSNGNVGDFGKSIAIDISGNVYITGYFAGINADFNPDTGTANLTSAGSYDIFLAKYAQCSLTATAPSDQSICNGSSASISVTVSGGTTPYSYLWSNGATAFSITVSPNATTNYLVTVSDAGGCSATDSVLITVNASPNASITTSDVSCNGGNNGTATATGGLNFMWSNGATTQTITNLAAGNYTVTVVDGNGCQATATATVSQPAAINIGSSPNDVSCNGMSDGSIDITVSGGTTPFTYTWFNGATTEDISNLPPGSYSVTVTDASGCTATGSALINQPPAITLSISKMDVTCASACNGNAIASVSGGTGGISFLWYNGSTASFLSSLCAGIYDLTVTDDNGCTATANATIFEPAVLSAFAPDDTVSCFGACDGFGSVAVSGGVSPYSYTWSTTPPQTMSTASALCAGSYNVTFTDMNNCSGAFGISVFEPQQLTVSVSPSQVCQGQCNGIASAAANGGVTPYSYMWNDPFIQTSQTASGLCSGAYNVTVTDGNGCNATQSFSINELSPLSVSVNQTNITCYGQCNGTASPIVSGGSAPYIFNWSNGAMSGDSLPAINNLCSGLYDVSVTDANNCSASSPQFSIGDANPLNVFVSINNASCNGCQDGSAQIDSVTGGTPPYSFNWSNGQTSTGISGIGSGNYNVIITDSNACTLSYNFNINQPMQANINFTNDTSNVCAPYAVNFTNLSTGNYDFYWNVRNDYLDTTINADSISFLFETGGYYQVELCAFDSMGNNVGCAIHDVNIYGFSMQMSASSACPGDAVGFEVNQNNNGGGGNGGSSYTWDFGDGTTGSSEGDKNLHTYDSPGAYTITVIGDHPQCGPDTVSTSLLVTDTVMPTVYYFTNSWNSCPNDMVSFMPYNAPGIYTWDFGDGSPLVVNELFETEHSFPDTGIYVVTVSVTNSCGNSDSYSDTVYIQNNLGFYDQNLNNYSISPNPVCPGDLVQFRYEYPDNFKTYIWNFGDGNSDTNNLQAYHSFATAGTYIASITIVNGCGYDTTLYDTLSVQNNVAINSGDYQFFPIPLATCPGDSVLFLAEDGAQSYMWHFGDGDSAVPYGIGSGDITAYNHAFADTGTYYASLTITNGCGNSLTDTFPLPVVVSTDVVPAINPLMGQAFGMLGSGTNETQPVCVPDSFIALTGGSLFHWDFGDGSPGVTTANIIVAHTYIYTGSYTVSLIAENSCGNSDTFSVMLNVGGVCPSPSVAVTGNNPTCYNSNNGNALASASGGTAPYTYQWSNGKTTALNGNLLAGTYSVTVTDVNGMTATGSITLTAPPAITLSMSANPASCGMSNGLASVTASGGATPYTYLWSNGQTSSIANNLSAGQYSVTVTASNGCKAVGSTTVNATSGFTAAFTGTNITCNGANNGSAVISASGGTSPYSYSWSSGATSASLSSLAAGTYNATVTDNTGCAITGSVQVSQPPVLALILNGTNVSSCGGNNGSVNLTVFGGVSPYTYLWNNNATTEDISSLSAGIYTVTVTDANNCTKTKSVLITAPSSASLSFTKTNATCNGSCNGTASVTINGGTAPYFYNWSNGAVNSTASGLCAGTYSVSIVDSAGCAVSGSVTILQPTALTINASSAPANCGLATGNAIADCDGGIPPYIYQWSSGDVDTTFLNSSVDSLLAGVYLVTGTDSNGCSVFVSVQVSDLGAPNINLNLGILVSCYGGNDGEIDITVTGTGTPFTYQWSNGAISQDINNLVAGPYEVTVTNSNGCIAVESFNVQQPEALSLSVSVNNATCGNADGNAEAMVIGGWTPYTYDWSNGGSASQISNLTSQIYNITVTDDNGCTAVSSAAVGEEGGPLVTLDSITAANCAGAGSIYVSISDGVPPYTYNWDNGSVNEDLVGVLTGNYGLLVTDANGCTGAISAQIINTQITTDPICLLTVDTATGTNKIVWQKTLGNGISAYKIYKESSFAGVYQLAGTIPFDSLSVFTDPVANPLQHSWRYKLAAVDSCGNESVISDAHKTMHVTVNLGIGNTINLIWDHYEGFSFGTYYIYRFKPLTGWAVQDSLASSLTSWTDLDPPSSFAGLRYYVEARHPNGCFPTKSVENHNSSRSNKTYPLAPPASDLTATQTSANDDGSCNGSAAVVASGGVSPYTYQWITGDTTSAVDSLCSGSYSCTITDVDGDTAIVNITILLVNIAKIGDEEIRMIVYPNPNDGTFAVQCKMENQKCTGGKIIIYNMLGGIVYHSAIASHQSPGTIDLSAHGSGLYYLQLITEKGNSVPLKIVVQ